MKSEAKALHCSDLTRIVIGFSDLPFKHLFYFWDSQVLSPFARMNDKNQA